jgi:hypothetical protein
MARVPIYIIAAAMVLVVVLALADLSTRSETCMACHAQEAAYATWMADKLKAEKKGFAHELISCAGCHMKGAAEGTVASRFRGLLHAVTYLVPQIDPRRPLAPGMLKEEHIASENCQYCHLGSIRRKAVWMKDLPEGLKKIGLAMDHRKHVLAREDTCAKCHERYKEKEKLEADKEVNYAEVNHLSCASCHTRASHAYRSDWMFPLSEKGFVLAREEAWKKLSTNPRWMVAIPTEQTCKRCHNGKIHYKTLIFLADCARGTNYDDCVKCHPLMTREYFNEHRRKRSGLTTAQGWTPADGG